MRCGRIPEGPCSSGAGTRRSRCSSAYQNRCSGAGTRQCSSRPRVRKRGVPAPELRSALPPVSPDKPVRTPSSPAGSVRSRWGCRRSFKNRCRACRTLTGFPRYSRDLDGNSRPAAVRIFAEQERSEPRSPYTPHHDDLEVGRYPDANLTRSTRIAHEGAESSVRLSLRRGDYIAAPAAEEEHN